MKSDKGDLASVIAALIELVRLKDLKDEIRRLQDGGDWPEQNRAVALGAEYRKQQPLAWEAARAALAAVRESAGEEQKPSETEATAHPEDRCEECGRPNIVWFAPNEIWNAVAPTSDILCPVCFVKHAEAAGFNKDAWKVEPEFYRDALAPVRESPETTSEPNAQPAVSDAAYEALRRDAWRRVNRERRSGRDRRF